MWPFIFEPPPSPVGHKPAMNAPKSLPAIEFVVLGGSVSGVCAAYSLRQAGHNVLVLEKREAGIVTHGGLRIPPNMARLLQTLPGATELLEKYGTRCSGMTFVDPYSAEVIGRMKFIDDIMSDLDAFFYMFPVEVASVELRPQARPALVTVSGERIEADVPLQLVGADGHRSIVRDAMQALQEVEVEENDDGASDGSSHSLPSDLTNISGSRAACPILVSALQHDPELVELANSTEFLIWPGTELLVTGHRCGPDLYTISVVRTSEPKNSDVESDWRPNALIINEDDLFLFHAQESRVQRLIGLARTYFRTIQEIPKSIVRLADPSLGIVLIGDAAHTVPVEDGFALGRISSHLTSCDQIPFFLNGYDQVRHKRTTATEASELSGMVNITLPPGPSRDARNRQLKAMSVVDDGTETLLPDEVIAASWGTYLFQFNYDANEAVDEWWINWGRLTRERT
ncbi:hypothetical protein FB451DRAFT_1181638 [Mycena latifolia]|nr:hypothetical protein FB451DRAFT_1181638 [Mycena latifolia]